MNTGTLVVVSLVALAILTAFVVMGVLWYRRTHIPWKPLPLVAGAVWYSRLSTTDPAHVSEALIAAALCLTTRTKWTAVQLAFVMSRTQVYVRDSEKWEDFSGQRVAGQQMGRSLVVGPSLAALCHELAHLCEEVLGEEVDFSHASWPVKGITSAVLDFDAWLSQHSKEHY